MYFLIEHNRITKKTDVKEYKEYTKAARESLKRERLHYINGKHEMEVVVFEAKSLEQLKRTHSRYFASASGDSESSGAGALLAVGLVGLAVYLLTKNDE